MGKALWSSCTKKELEKEFRTILESPKKAAFIAVNSRGGAVGFINLTRREEYVEGAETSPVAYIEGIYVERAYRHKGIAAELVRRSEQWARAHGCREMGSDVELKNLGSRRFHANIGFKEAGRNAHFIKNLRKRN